MAPSAPAAPAAPAAAEASATPQASAPAPHAAHAAHAAHATPAARIPGARPDRVASNFCAGATSGLLTTFLLQPLDVVKTRMQLPSAFGRTIGLVGPKALNIPENAGILDTLRGIIGHDGPKGLWRGTVPTVTRNMLGVGLYFVTLNNLSNMLKSKDDGTLSASSTLLAGASARSCSAIFLCPLSVIKTRFETVELASKYRGVMDAAVTIARKERLRGLFSGLVPTIARDAPYSALYLILYLRTRESLCTFLDVKSSMGVNFAAGFFGGGLATLLTQPQDVVKTRLQLSRHVTGRADKYATVWQAVKRIFREEGFYGFFRGSSPRFFKRCLGSALTWMVYEETVHFYEELFLQREANIAEAEEARTSRPAQDVAATR